MLCEEWITLSTNWSEVIILNQLPIGQHPVSKSKQEEGSKLQVGEYRVVELLVISWRLLEYVVKHEFLKAEQGDKGASSCWEKEGKTWSEHHGDENDVHDA
jgi:hypothetical protein